MVVSLLKLFVKPNNKMIVFSSFGGRKYDDSPKAIYEAMIRDPRFDGYEFVWAFMHPEDFELPKGRKVLIDTLKYYKTLLSARVWVTNSSMTRGLTFTGKNTFLLNTWHGSAIKRMGSDINDGNTSFGVKRKKKKESSKNIFLAQSEYDVDVFTRAFKIPRDNFKIVGLPRNDKLASFTNERQMNMKRKLGIPAEKKVILYAPTFREYNKDAGNNVILIHPINTLLWQECLGDDYVLLFRAHYEVARVMGIESSDFVKNVSSYPSLDDLMLASDMLVSDYSSIFFDYAIMHKPMFCYAYDYDVYAERRGMYFDIREWLPSVDNEEDLISLIKNTNVSVENETSRKFQEHYVTEFGTASQKAVNIIFDELIS